MLQRMRGARQALAMLSVRSGSGTTTTSSRMAFKQAPLKIAVQQNRIGPDDEVATED